MSSHSPALHQAFVRGGWAPRNKQVVKDWVRRNHQTRLSKKGTLSSGEEESLIPAVQRFKKFIEGDPVILDGFERMFKEDPPFAEIQDYKDLLAHFNIVLQETPSYGDLGPPIYMLMFHVMNTKSGWDTFAIERLNAEFKELFVSWAAHLSSPASTDRLNKEVGGWFHEDAMKAATEDFPGIPFGQVFFTPNPKAMTLGYKSFDEYFNRKFASDVRQVEFPERTDIIGGACESVMYKLATDVELSDEFWIKGEPYSLNHMLNSHRLADQFKCGTVYQGFLQVTNYHRWHAPIAGKIVDIVDVPGTYFNMSPALIGDTEEHPYLRSLAYLTAVAARQLIFIDADNKDIGLMCFIAIGMTEISTCEATVKIDDHVKRGDELGMFHFGGSSHALVFGPQVKLQFFDDYNKEGQLIRVNAAIAGVVKD